MRLGQLSLLLLLRLEFAKVLDGINDGLAASELEPPPFTEALTLLELFDGCLGVFVCESRSRSSFCLSLGVVVVGIVEARTSCEPCKSDCAGLMLALIL